ncbi:NAD(P)/FAD-dependent oxidoreductase [Paenochrobactrum pullorum]|uniref:NAD(P)/FAD-dependent oxidoreductase n=1 Tax=Paenochrobactrum pullorum TaxID=1324351 RepID=UPI0035BBDFD8
MGPVIDKIVTSQTLPQKTDVAIIGGGIIGVSTALFLAERGIHVTLFEKGTLACEQSSRNWGWCRQNGRDSREIPLIRESMKIWNDLNEKTGHETGFRASGIVYTTQSQAQIETYEKWVEIAREHGLDSKILSAREAMDAAPGLTQNLVGGMKTIGDGRAEPQKAVPAMAVKAMQDGATILENCAVRGIETTNGKVSAVVTERGVVACQAVVIAGGAWSRLICKGLGLRLPQLKLRGSVFRTQPLDAGIDHAIYYNDFGIRKRLDGGYTIAAEGGGVADIIPDSFAFFREYLPTLLMEWRTLHLRFGERFFEELIQWRNKPFDQVSVFEKIRTLDPSPHRRANLQALEKVKQAFPQFKVARIEQEWAGLIDTMPDVIPVISEAANVEGVTIATGFSGHGFGIGPGAGHLIADMVTGATPIVDPTPFRFSRFTDGSKLTIEKWG